MLFWEKPPHVDLRSRNKQLCPPPLPPPSVKRAPWGPFFGSYLHHLFFNIAELSSNVHKPSWQALNKKLPIWTWEKNDPNHPCKRLHPPSPLRQCPFTQTIFPKGGFPKTLICLLKTKSWKVGTCLKLLDWFWSISFTFQDAARADECAIRSRRTGKWQEVPSKKLRGLSCLGHEFEVDVRWGRAQNPPLLNYVSINFLSRGLTISPGRLIRTSHHLGRRHVTNIQRDANRSTTFSLAGRPCLDHIGQCCSDTFHPQT